MEEIEQNRLATAIESCQRGRLDDFGLVYDAYIKKIYAFVYQKTFNREVAEDLTSKTFMNALRHIGSFDAGKSSFNTWIYRIARNNVIDYYRSKKEEIGIETIFDLSSGLDIEADTNNLLLLEEVQRKLSKFDARQREIILLRLWDGLSYKEISALLEIPADNAKMIFYRAINKLREDLILPMIFFLSYLLN